MSETAHIYITRSTAEHGDGSLIYPAVPFRVSLFFSLCVKSLVMKRIRDQEMTLRRKEGGERTDAILKEGLRVVTHISGSFRGAIARLLWLGDTINVYSLKIKPDTGCNDPRARNPDFIMHVVLYRELNFASAAFKRFAKRCLEIAFAKKSPGGYRDLVVQIPDDVLGRIAQGVITR